MNGIFSYIIKIAIISLIIFLSPVYSQTVLFDNLENSSSTYTEDTDVAQQFTTTADLRFITEVELGIHNVFNASGDFTVSIYSNNSGVDGIGLLLADIYTGSNSILSNNSDSTFKINQTNDYNNCLPLELAGDTKYWIYVTSSTTDIFEWNYSDVSSGSGAGFLARNMVGVDTYYDTEPMLLKITANNVLPVELTTFTANLNENKVILNWQTATEVNNYGFQVERQKEKGESEWEVVGFVEGHGNSNSPKDYTFTDNLLNLSLNLNLTYRLKQIDFDGNYEYSDVVKVELAENIKTYKLEQNYPNPFNPSTEIRFSIPQNSNVKLELFNMIGEKVATLINEEMAAGSHNYQLSISNYQLSSGIYLYKLQSGSFVQTRKLMLLK